MSLQYRVYANDGQGGPVNYSSPIATTAALSYSPAPLAAPSDSTFAVRAFDPVTGLEEANTEARVRILLDAQGQDISNRPNAPRALSVRATAGGGCQVRWAYSTAGQSSPPLGFLVYLTAGTVADYQSPAASIPYLPGRAGYSCDLTGLADGVTYSVAVRSTNATATELNTTVVTTVVGHSVPPDNVDSLTATATFGTQ